METPLRRLTARGPLLMALGMVVWLAGSVFGFTPDVTPAASARPLAQAAPGTSTVTAPTPAAVSNGARPGDADTVYVVSLSGLIDPILADFMNQTINDAERARATALVFQVDLQGSAIPAAQLKSLLARIRTATVPVYLWIGPTGSELAGNATWLVFGVGQLGDPSSVGMAPGTHIGGLQPGFFGVLEADTAQHQATSDTEVAALSGTLDTQQAIDAHIAVFAPTIGDFIVNLPGVQTKETTVNNQPKREPVTKVVFNQLPIFPNFMHTVSSPAVAYLLFTIGLALLIFELFTAGVGVAGVIGAGSLVLGCFGLAVLPIHWWGVACILAAMLAFAVDVQTGVPRFWTGAGMVLYVLGSLTLYDGVSMSWLTIAVGIIGVALAFLAGMPSMVRTRFSTPTIGREWMIGEMGRAVTDIDPDGVVQIKEAQWRAYTNRATPIEQLDKVRVVGIEGLVLEVEPEEGAAKDYRDRSGKNTTPADPTD